MIIFKHIEMEGFGIYVKPFSFQLDKPGINVLALSNGSGKSTIFGALIWALYGKPLKPKSTIPSYPQLRDDNWKGTQVTLSFKKGDTSYVVTRCMDWNGKVHGEKGRNKVFLTVGGTPYQEFKDKRAIDQFIESIIGYSFELFTNTIIFPQKSKRFIEERGVDKRRIFEEVFNLEWIGNALTLAKDQRSKKELKVSKLTGSVNKLSAEIDSMLGFIERVEESRKEFEKEKSDNIKDLEDKIKELEDSLDKSPPDGFLLSENVEKVKKEVEEISNSFSQKKYDEVSIQVDRALQLSNKTNAEISKLKEELGSLEGREDPVCPTCNQVLSSKKTQVLVDHYNLEIDNLKVGLTENNKLYMTLKKNLNSLSELRKSLKEKTTILEELRAKKAEVDAKLNQQQKIWDKIDHLRDSLETQKKSKFKDISGEIRAKVKTKKKELETYNKELRTHQRGLEILKWAIASPLSENGIKSFLINSMINLLNQRLTEYSQYINFEVKLEVDMERSRKDIYTIVNRNGYPVLLEDLSGGETQLVNVVVTFGLYDLTQSLSEGIKTNLQVFDEVFESLDPENVEVVSDLINQRALHNTSIFIITHKKNFSIRNANSLSIWGE